MFKLKIKSNISFSGGSSGGGVCEVMEDAGEGRWCFDTTYGFRTCLRAGNYPER